MPFSIIAAVVTGVASMVLGFVWYGPLFAKIWMKEVGMSEAKMKGGPGVGYLIAFLSSTYLGFVTSLMVHFLGITDVVNGAGLGAILAGGFVLTTFATNYIFAKRSLRLYLIDAGYQTLLVVIAGIVCAVIR